MDRKMAGAFVSWALAEPDLTFRARVLYRQYCRITSKEAGDDRSKSQFRAMMGKLSSRGECVSLFRGCWTFPDAPVHVPLWASAEAPWVIVQDGLRSLGYVGNTGGFDVLFGEGDIHVPPKATVIFSNCPSFMRVSAELRSRAGAVLRIRCFVVPRKESVLSTGLVRRAVAGFPYRESSPERAYEEALWLTRSPYGGEGKTGLAGQGSLLLEAPWRDRWTPWNDSGR